VSDRIARHFISVHATFKLEESSNLEIDVSTLHLIAAPKERYHVRFCDWQCPSAKVPAAAVFLPRAPRKVQIEKSAIPPTALIQP
jgi:hypothetical protein